MTTEPKNESKKNKNELESKSIETSLNSEENFFVSKFSRI